MSKFFCVILFSFPLFLIAQVNFNSSNLPIVIINTDGQEIIDEPRIVCSMGIINNDSINNIGDNFNEYSGKISIELRGESSMNFPKKSYSFETQDSLGENYNVPLLGMPAENDWILYAPYGDKSFLRNALTYHLYEKMGYYSPRFRFCNLFINDEYMGLYLLIEKIKRDKNRIDINELEVNNNSIEEISGGYILQVDRASDNSDQYWSSFFNDSIYFQYVYPRWKNINSAQKLYIQEFIYEFEYSILNSNINSLHMIYDSLINVKSFVDYFIVSELSKNIDAYRLSTYLYKDHDSVDNRLHIGPVWDFNWAYGNSTYCQADIVSGWEEETPCGIFNPFWYSIFRSDSLFNNLLNCRWQNLRTNVLDIDNIHAYIDSSSLVCENEINKDMILWGHFESTTHVDEIIYLKEWVSQRILWIDENIPGNCQYFENFQSKDLIMITDILGRSVIPKSNMPLFYIYEDRTVEKKIIIE
tara:strand:- start:82 stop:1497 length:1416 start_codon:yes stop_codon:yes gene_type:complete